MEPMMALVAFAMFIIAPFVPPYVVARLRLGQGDVAAATVVMFSAALPILILFFTTQGDSINAAALVGVWPFFWLFCLIPAGIGRTIGRWQARRANP